MRVQASVPPRKLPLPRGCRGVTGLGIGDGDGALYDAATLSDLIPGTPPKQYMMYTY